MMIQQNDIEKALSRKKHERFISHCWQDVSEPFILGFHIQKLCRLIDDAFDKFRHGKSTFLVVGLPFRHGKSSVLSRYTPPHFLGEFPDKEVMLVTYASSLAEDFSRYARDLINSDEYKELYPEVKLSKHNSGVQQWGIEGHLGKCVASGLSSGITGKGYHLGLLDDYCASRAEAESDVLRNKAWEHFTNDFLTRRAPVSITIVLATPWHVDDIIGRIKSKIDPESESYDENFPPFKVVSFPAKNGEIDISVKDETSGKRHLENVHYDYLFTEALSKDGRKIKGRFTPEWYEQQFASLGEYAASALLQCNPQIKGGNLINLSKIKIHDDVSDFPKMKYYRIWDLAHSEKQRIKDDPDWTSGTLLGYRRVNGVWELWIKDVARMRGKAPERDNFIKACSLKDGQGVTIGVESSLDSKDAVATMETIFNGSRIVRGIKTVGDKVSRMSYVEPIFEAGNVHILKGAWNFDWLNEVREFPSGKHDDQVDNLSAGYTLICEVSRQITLSGVYGV